MQDWPLVNTKLQLLTFLSTNASCHIPSLAAPLSWFWLLLHLPEFSFDDFLLSLQLQSLSLIFKRACLHAVPFLVFLSSYCASSMSNCVYDLTSTPKSIWPAQTSCPRPMWPFSHLRCPTNHHSPSNITNSLSLWNLVPPPASPLPLSWWITCPSSPLAWKLGIIQVFSFCLTPSKSKHQDLLDLDPRDLSHLFSSLPHLVTELRTSLDSFSILKVNLFDFIPKTSPIPSHPTVAFLPQALGMSFLYPNDTLLPGFPLHHHPPAASASSLHISKLLDHLPSSVKKASLVFVYLLYMNLIHYRQLI